MKKIRLRLHSFFSVRCSRYIMKITKEKKDLKRIQRFLFSFCSYWEFKLRRKKI